MGPGGVGQLAAGHAEDLGRRRPALTEVLAEAPVRLVALVGRPPVVVVRPMNISSHESHDLLPKTEERRRDRHA